MKTAQLRFLVPAALAVGMASGPATAQRPLDPVQRIAILEQQVAASQATAMRLEQRLDSIQRQLQQLINQGEVNGHRISELQNELNRLKSDSARRLDSLESRSSAQPPVESAIVEPRPAQSRPQTAAVTPPRAARPEDSSAEGSSGDPGEDAYSEGFRLWRDGNYDQAVTALRAFVSGFPNHRRTSFARNLIGRALLDKGQPRPAAEALLANYRTDPKGERAPDSLYYLGQALMKLNQPGQACKAYAELEDVYGASIRPDLKALVTKGKADARC